MPVVQGMVNQMGFKLLDWFLLPDKIPVHACMGYISDEKGAHETIPEKDVSLVRPYDQANILIKS